MQFTWFLLRLTSTALNSCKDSGISLILLLDKSSMSRCFNWDNWAGICWSRFPLSSTVFKEVHKLMSAGSLLNRLLIADNVSNFFNLQMLSQSMAVKTNKFCNKRHSSILIHKLFAPILCVCHFDERII